MPLGPDPWIIARFRREESALVVDHEGPDGPADSTVGTDWVTVPLPPFGLWETTAPVPPPGFPTEVRIPPSFLEAVAAGLAKQEARSRYGPHATGAIPLPVFVEPWPEAEEWAWEACVRELLRPDFDLDRVQVVRAAPESARRSPFSLPFDVLATGPTAAYALGPIQAEDWWAGNAEVQEYGLRIEEGGPLPMALARVRQGVDVLLTQGPEGPATLETVRRLELELRPRLVIWMLDGLEVLTRVTAPPSGTALLALPPGPDTPSFVRSLLYGLVHDYPLHEALKAALRDMEQTRGELPPQERPWLVADPVSNQSLRMADAYEALVQESNGLGKTVQTQGLLELLEAYPEEEAGFHGFVFEGAAEAEEVWPEVESAVERKEDLPFAFNQEVMGLVPFSEAKARVERARTAEAAASEALRRVAEDELALEEIGRAQDRRVEMEMDLLARGDDGTFYYRPSHPDYDRALAPGSGFRVRVYVGAPSKRSIVEGEVGSIDPLLPELADDGHDLDIVFYEKDFRLLSPRLRRTRLPRYGGTEPVEFELEAPDREGPAQGRILVFHGNQLLQSFLFTATVAQDAVAGDDDRIRVRLEMARSARFTNLDELKPRTISLGMNQDPQGTHTLFVKKDDAAASPLTLPEAAVERWTLEFREILERYAWDEARQGPGFDFRRRDPAPPDERFDAAIRELAVLGGGIHDGLFQRRGSGLGPLLKELKKGQDLAVQISRHDPNYAFPWSVVYDLPLPKEIAGQPRAPVCRGAPLDDGVAAGPPSTRRGCPHNPGRDVYCVEGFWGVRHQLEQLLPNGRRSDQVPAVVGRGGPPAVRLALSIRTPDVVEMEAAFQRELADAVGEMPSDEDPLDLLWDGGRRPSALVILGHLAVQAADGEPEGQRLLLLPPEKFAGGIPPDFWLQPGDIVQWTKDHDPLDGHPAPLILLMACDSGATEIAELNGFTTSFVGAGAAAVVGTESTVFASLASRFALDVVLGLWRGDGTLGQVVQRFNQEALSAGIPVPFAFSAVGNMDLEMEAPQ